MLSHKIALPPKQGQQSHLAILGICQAARHSLLLTLATLLFGINGLYCLCPLPLLQESICLEKLNLPSLLSPTGMAVRLVIIPRKSLWLTMMVRLLL
jgi:hypothetical protein